MPRTLPLLTTTEPLVCVPLSMATTLTDEEATEFAVRLKAIADPTRLKIVTHLLSAPGNEACICELTPVLSLSDATVNHHFKTLVAAGIVSKERRGMNVHYRIDPESIHAIARALYAGCC